MKNYCACVLLIAIVCSSIASNSALAVIRFDDGGEHTVGGGPSDRITADIDTTVNILDETIIGGLNGPALEDGTSALTALHGGHINVAGGGFFAPEQGTYFRAGHGARLVEGSIEIQDGTFVSANDGSRGSGLDLFRSEAVIHGGVFRGQGAATAHHGSTMVIHGGVFIGRDVALTLLVGDYEIHGGQFSVTNPGAETVLAAFSEFELDIFGGQFDGIIGIGNGTTTIHGNNLAVTDPIIEGHTASLTVSGSYGSGEAFSHDLRISLNHPDKLDFLQTADSVRIRSGLPEPSTLALLALSTAALLGKAWRDCRKTP